MGSGPNPVESIEILEELEALEAPPVKYGAPVLSQVDAAAKIEVANEVLALVSQAFDEAEGPGRGRAVMQLLVDGVPSQFAALLHDLKVGEGGELPDDQLLPEPELASGDRTPSAAEQQPRGHHRTGVVVRGGRAAGRRVRRRVRLGGRVPPAARVVRPLLVWVALVAHADPAAFDGAAAAPGATTVQPGSARSRQRC